MKEILDWLRERINEKKGTEFYGVKYINASTIKRIINEAEAKWKEDCCEWKGDGVGIFSIETSCGKLIERNNDYRVCPYCGKRIKISEVE